MQVVLEEVDAGGVAEAECWSEVSWELITAGNNNTPSVSVNAPQTGGGGETELYLNVSTGQTELEVDEGLKHRFCVWQMIMNDSSLNQIISRWFLSEINLTQTHFSETD